MFGLLLHNIPKYSVVLHHVSVTFAIALIQLYKIIRNKKVLDRDRKIIPLIGELQQGIDNKSDISPNAGAAFGKTSSNPAAAGSMHMMKTLNKKSFTTIGGAGGGPKLRSTSTISGSGAFKSQQGRPSVALKLIEKNNEILNKLNEQQ